MFFRQRIQAPSVLRIAGTAAAMMLLLAAAGCVSSGTYKEALQEKDLLSQKADQLESEKNAALEKVASLEIEKSQLQQLTQQTEEEKARMAAAVEAAKAEAAKQKATFDSLRGQFSEEMKSNQVKIEMLKTGIKVNLAQEVLFPSGSAKLNDSGEAILRKIAPDLKQGSYQLIVAGFTDNVAISSGLLDRYPSNWELAGARAASVVRLLEKEGVPPERMVATSFGENSPVAGNDTPEGRAQNRRIEISLRPVEIETAQP